MEYKITYLDKERIRYIKEGKGKALLFLHGFTISPHNYNSLIENLADEFTVIAPELHGINNQGNSQRTLDTYVSLTHDFCEKFGSFDYIVGHSLGAYIGLRFIGDLSKNKSIMAINPVLPMNYGIFGFLIRSLKKELKQVFGFYDGIKSIPKGLSLTAQSTWYILNNLNDSVRTVMDISRCSYDGLRIKQPTLILFSENDEYFSLDNRIEGQLKQHFDKLEIKRLKSYGHDWPLFIPKEASQEIKDFLL